MVYNPEISTFPISFALSNPGDLVETQPTHRRQTKKVIENLIIQFPQNNCRSILLNLRDLEIDVGRSIIILLNK